MFVYIIRLKKKALTPPRPFYLNNVRNKKWHSNLPNLHCFGKSIVSFAHVFVSLGWSHHSITSSNPFPSVHLCCVCILTSHVTCGSRPVLWPSKSQNMAKMLLGCPWKLETMIVIKLAYTVTDLRDLQPTSTGVIIHLLSTMDIPVVILKKWAAKYI